MAPSSFCEKRMCAICMKRWVNPVRSLLRKIAIRHQAVKNCMSFDQLVEAKIREALDQGRLDHLRVSGQPLRLDEYFSLPEEYRLIYTLLKDSGFIPEEVSLLRELGEVKAQLESTTDAAKQRELQQQMENKKLRLNLLLESYRRKRNNIK